MTGFVMNPYTNDIQRDFSYSNSAASKNIANIAQNVLTKAALPGSNDMQLLGPNFTSPGRYDVICARGKSAWKHSGNAAFRRTIQESLGEYSAAMTKTEKSNIVSKIVDAVRERSPNGGFIRQVDGRWFEVGDHIAREKCGQCFRDLLHTKYKSSTKAKMRKRRNIQQSDSMRNEMNENPRCDKKPRNIEPEPRGSNAKHPGEPETISEVGLASDSFAEHSDHSIGRVLPDSPRPSCRLFSSPSSGADQREVVAIPEPIPPLSAPISWWPGDEPISASIFDDPIPCEALSQPHVSNMRSSQRNETTGINEQLHGETCFGPIDDVPIGPDVFEL